MKKAQMEVMGLALIVILLVLGMLFMVKFVIFKEAESPKADYEPTQLAANTLNTLLITTTDCNKASVSELIQDAGKVSPTILCPNDQTSKEYVRGFISDILTDSLGALQREYYFEARYSATDVVTPLGVADNTREREAKTAYLPGESIGQTITITLYIYI